MNITSFHHVSVNTNGTDSGELDGFYRNVLGLTHAERPEIPGIPGAWFSVADQQLHIVDVAPTGEAIDIVSNHFCFRVTDLDDVITQFERDEIPYVTELQDADTLQVWINDPAGNTIEFQQDMGAT